MDFSTLQSTTTRALVETTRTVNEITAEDLGFHRSLDRTVAKSLDKQNARLLSLAQRLLKSATAGTEVVGATFDGDGADAVDASWRGVVDVIDSLLEKADSSLDEYTGVVKRLSPGREQTPVTEAQKRARLGERFGTRDTLAKPQLDFDVAPENYATEIFKPFLESKPHAQRPLKDSLQILKNEHGEDQYEHPYYTEISQYQYPSFVYEKAEPIPYKPYESTTATWVDTPEAVDEMLQELKRAKEIAIDLEHHDTHSYIGIVSLMQISTRDRDWIVDTLKPWRRKLQVLNEVLTDPNILKVLHGAYMDIVWLQRDLGLYIVGLFDTHNAARALGYPGGSLAYLLQRFVNFQAQKQYQIADWRIRPLPKEMFEYARSDTHFLLYIYDNIRNELIERSDFSNPEADKILVVLEKSKETSLQRYENRIYNAETGRGEGGWYKMLAKSLPDYSKEQFAVFRAVHQWRDDVARREDVNTTYVIPNHAIFSIARNLPADRTQLLQISMSSGGQIGTRIDEILHVVNEARKNAEKGPAMSDIFPKAVGNSAYQPTITAGSVAAAAQAVHRPKTPSELPQTNGLPARSMFSKFWGTITAPFSQQRRSMTTAEDIRLALPLPQLTAEIFQDASAAAASQPNTPQSAASRAEHAYTKQRPAAAENDGIFVIKGNSNKRKRETDVLEEVEDATDPPAKQTPPPPPPQPPNGSSSKVEDLKADEMDLDPSEAERAEKKRLKRERKQARKEARAAAKANGQGDGEEEGEEEEAFDYSKAASVLNAPRENGGVAGGKVQKGFSLGAKALNAPKGLGRAQKERAGKSKSFKN